MATSTYTTIVAPIAEAQIDAALLWWSRNRAAARDLLAARKSLFGKANRCGLPIGNLTSQFWGNVYLHELDEVVKRRLGVRWYVRYVDDLILVSHRPEEPECWREAIRDELHERLGLALRREGDVPFRVGRGIDFVGWRTWWSHRVPRRRTLGRVATRLNAFERRHWRTGPVRGARSLALAGEGAERAVDHLRTSLASSAGHLQHTSAWRAWAGTWARYPWLDALFARDGWRFLARWSPPLRFLPPRFGAQYRQLVAHAGQRTLVFCPVGRFVEFYGRQRLVAERELGLRQVYLPRAGYGFTAGFPRARTSNYLQRSVDAGLAVVLVGARGDIRRAVPRVRWPARLVVAQPRST